MLTCVDRATGRQGDGGGFCHHSDRSDHSVHSDRDKRDDGHVTGGSRINSDPKTQPEADATGRNADAGAVVMVVSRPRRWTRFTVLDCLQTVS